MGLRSLLGAPRSEYALQGETGDRRRQAAAVGPCRRGWFGPAFLSAIDNEKVAPEYA
jgi:hypothetical protein